MMNSLICLLLALSAVVPTAALESSNACYMTCVASKLSSRGKRSIFSESLAKFCQTSDLQGNMRILVECVDECDADVREDSYIKNFRAIISLCEKLQYDEKMTCVNEKTNLTDIEFDQLDNVCDFYSNWFQWHLTSYISCKFVAEEIIRVGNILGQMWSMQKNLDYKDLGSCVKEWPLTKIFDLSVGFLTLEHENKVETCFDLCGAKADDFNGKLPESCAEFDKYSRKLGCISKCDPNFSTNAIANVEFDEIYEKNCEERFQQRFDSLLSCYFTASKWVVLKQNYLENICEVHEHYRKQCGGNEKPDFFGIKALIKRFTEETAAEFKMNVDEPCDYFGQECFEKCNATLDVIKMAQNCAEFGVNDGMLNCIKDCFKGISGSLRFNETFDDTYQKNCGQAVEQEFNSFLNCHFSLLRPGKKNNFQDVCQIRDYYVQKCIGNKQLIEIEPLMNYFVQEIVKKLKVDDKKACQPAPLVSASLRLFPSTLIICFAII